MEDDVDDMDIENTEADTDVDDDDHDHDGDDDDDTVVGSIQWHSWSYRLHHGSFLIYFYYAYFHGFYHMYDFDDL